ncbi:response regulator [Sinorhizobium sp. BG8]|uniref:response regulator transcription factor n=1 Tax=Sinorhizobium sp. BG8 TaxID=2613773 RepID=UPI00193E2CC6|nr:response regulator [Sinorhizobium sp. BG8]QRM55290.1 response regulator transcription factor [Sinorhizobium sp. BG8]
MPEAADPQQSIPTIHVIDDDTDLRTALLGFFEAIGMRAAGFESAGAFLEHADLSEPGCILLDIRMPGMTGLELQAKLTELGFPLPIIFMTGNASVATSVSAMKAGALDYLVKPFSSESLMQATKQALEHNAELRARDAVSLQMNALVEKLTRREREVFGYVSKGLMNKQIAHEMQISEIMVKLHRGRMMKKLDARSIADVVRIFDEVNRRA